MHRNDILRHAYALNCENGGAAGVDGEKFADVEAYGLEQWLGELGKELQDGRYKPQAFDTIPHVELMKCLARRVSDAKILRLLKAWLKVPVEEQDERGKRRMNGGKKATKGTPQGGVISPLLANIYMHRYIKAFRKHGLDKKHGAVLVTYADDFVVLCRRGAWQVLERTRQWMTRIGLGLNEEKTCVRDGRRESFDFLGYTFGPMHSPRTGGRYLGAMPSKKAVKRLKEKSRQQLRPGNQAPQEQVVASLNRVLRGWANYFCYGTLGRARRIVDQHVYERVRHFLRRRHKVSSSGTSQFPQQWVFGELGVLVRELDDRDGHVRFDERARRNGAMDHSAKGARESRTCFRRRRSCTPPRSGSTLLIGVIRRWWSRTKAADT